MTSQPGNIEGLSHLEPTNKDNTLEKQPDLLSAKLNSLGHAQIVHQNEVGCNN